MIHSNEMYKDSSLKVQYEIMLYIYEKQLCKIHCSTSCFSIIESLQSVTIQTTCLITSDLYFRVINDDLNK